MTLPPINPKYRNYLIAATIVTKLVAYVVMLPMLDMFDYQNYAQAAANIIHGLLPWAGGTAVYYPPLAFIPMLLSYLSMAVTGDFNAFIITMWIFNIACDIVAAFCIYYIGLKLYTERTALIA